MNNHARTLDDQRRSPGGSSARRPARLALLATAIAVPALALVGPAQALDPTGVGPGNPAHSGFPQYYTDDSGVPLQLCVDGTAACLGATLTSDGAGGPGVNVAPDGEGFWWMATTDLSAPGLDLAVEFAAEAAWLDARTPITFDRVRIRGHSDTQGAIAVDTPYGLFTVDAGDPANQVNVNFTEDIGCVLSPCDFAEMTTDPAAHITSWITSTTPPAGYLGDGVTSESATVAGAPATISAGGATTSNWVVMGKRANPNAVSLPASVDFGNTDAVRTRSVRMINLGTRPLTIQGTSLLGSARITMLRTSTCTAGRALGVGGRCMVNLRYRPGARKQVGATLRINDSAPVGVRSIPVTARTAAIASASRRVRFTPVRAGGSGPTRHIVVTNTGSLPLRIRNVSLAGRNPSSFEIRNGAPLVCRAGTTVRPRKQCAVYVGFEPTGFGPKQANLILRSNALPARHVVTLSGNGR